MQSVGTIVLSKLVSLPVESKCPISNSVGSSSNHSSEIRILALLSNEMHEIDMLCHYGIKFLPQITIQIIEAQGNINGGALAVRNQGCPYRRSIADDLSLKRR